MTRLTRRRRNRRIKLGKALFVLPNLFTLSSIFCGFYSILLSSGQVHSQKLHAAAVAIFFALFFDMFDGRIARLTHTQSEFGIQLDSLADLVSFGVAPALLVYRWGLFELDVLGRLVAFCFIGAGAIRLARFNLQAVRQKGRVTTHFTGLPIPLAAGMLISLVMLHQRKDADLVAAQAHVAYLVVVLSYLMVSNVRYRSFKTIKPEARSIGGLMTLLAILIGVSISIRPSGALVLMFSSYIALGLLEEVVFFRKRRREDRPAVLKATNDMGTDNAPPETGL